MDDNSGGLSRGDMSSGSGGRGGGFSGGRGGYQGGYRGGAHGSVGGLGGRPGDLAQGDHMVHHGGNVAAAVAFKPAPEFEMKGNDFPALPGLDEPQKASETNESMKG
jgi:hypothetical protein